MSYLNFTPLGPGLDPTGISQVTNDNFYRLNNKLQQFDSSGWISDALPAISSVTYNGNRSYDITFRNDVSTILSPGMRLKTKRTVSAPTQCTSLNGTSQYWSKTSPAGMTFTDDFVVSAWVKLSSYATGTIASRFNGTSGWSFDVLSTGQVQLVGFNNGGSNTSGILSYQSIPLNKWVHLTAQLDMSAFTATTTTSYVMIDGVDVPAVVSRGGTNPTALIQAGDLNIGARNAALFFPGKIAQAAIFNAKVTQATMRGYMSQGLVGTETSLISAYSFNNSINDLNTTNANNLTAQGSAVATNADSPFSVNGSGTATGTDDVGLVQKVSSAVATVQVPAGCTIPTSGGIVATYISSVKNPYNWVSDSERWEVTALSGTYMFVPTNNTWYNLNSLRLQVPVGGWLLSYQMYNLRAAATWTSSTFINAIANLSTTSASAGNSYEQQKWSAATGYDGYATGSIPATCNGAVYKDGTITLSAATTYYLNYYITTGGTVYSASNQCGCNGPFFIRALPSGL